MADLAYPAYLAPSPGYVSGRPSAVFSTVSPLRSAIPLPQDLRILNPTTGTITDRVMLKAAGVDLPFANGRVWLLRLADGFKAWEGWSDASGSYTATGLELGVKYIPVAIDPYGNQKATAAGPVTATLAE